MTFHWNHQPPYQHIMRSHRNIYTFKPHELSRYERHGVISVKLGPPIQRGSLIELDALNVIEQVGYFWLAKACRKPSRLVIASNKDVSLAHNAQELPEDMNGLEVCISKYALTPEEITTAVLPYRK